MGEIIESKNGRSLSAIIHESNGPVVILCHGYRSGKDRESTRVLSETLQSAGFSTIRFDFNGHGDSEGEFEDLTVSRAMDDLRGVIDYAKTRMPDRKIAVVGSSFGGMVSGLVSSANNDVSALVLKAPVSDFRAVQESKLGKAGIQAWKKRGILPAFDFTSRKSYALRYSYFEDGVQHDVYRFAKKIRAPTLIVHGDADQVVPIAHSEKLLKALKADAKKLVVFRGTDHPFEKPGEMQRYNSAVLEWLNTHLT